VKVIKKNFKEILLMTGLLSNSENPYREHYIVVTPRFARVFTEGDDTTSDYIDYFYDGIVRRNTNIPEAEIMDCTFNGIPLPESHLLMNRFTDTAHIEHAGNYIVVYTMSRGDSRLPLYVTGYIVYDAKTFKPVDKVIIVSDSILESYNIGDNYTLLPYFMLYDKWNKTFYTYIKGEKSQKKLIITILKKNKIEKHVVDVDRLFIERWNPISGKVYGVTFENNKIKVSGVLQKEFFEAEAKLQDPYGFNPGIDIIDSMHLSVLPGKKVDIFFTYSKLIPDGISKAGKKYIASNAKDNNPKKKRSLIAEFRDMSLYVETDAHIKYPITSKVPPSYLLYKKDRLIKKFDPVFIEGETMFTVYKNGKPIKEVTTSREDADKKHRQYQQLLESNPIASSSELRSGNGNYYGAVVIQGSKNFAFVEWGKDVMDDELKSIVRIFDYNGNCVYTLNMSNIVIPVIQDTDSPYVVYFKQNSKNKNDITMNILSVDNLKNISVPIIKDSFLWHKVTYVPKSVPRLTYSNLYSDGMQFKFCCDNMIVYDSEKYKIHYNRRTYELKEIFAYRLYATVNLKIKKAHLFRKSPIVYVQDPYIALQDSFNAIVDNNKEVGQERWRR
jgi:hypothetical protein